MTSLPVKKHPPVSVSAAEAATNFKMFLFLCIGSFRRYCAHFKVFYLRTNVLKRDCVIPVHPDMKHWCLHVKSCLKRKILSLHLDMFPCNPKIGVSFSPLFYVDSFLVSIVLNGTKHMFPAPLAQYKNFSIMRLILFTLSIGSAGDVSSSFIF